VVGIQDLGGAGLACATSETAGRAGMGMDVDVGAVPRRAPGMEPFEVLTSESQERMLAIVTPADRVEVEEVCRRWEVRATVIGIVTAPRPAGDGGADGGGRLRIFDAAGGEVLVDVPAASLSDDAPLYDRPMAPPADLDRRRADDPATLEPPTDCGVEVLAMLCDTSWVWHQYDHQLFLNTVTGPGGDAAVLRLAAPGLPSSRRGLALSTDSNPRWCALDPRAGTALVVAESALNVACAGARPVALVNCLNFGNPEHPEVMWQLSEAIDGMAEACRALSIPVVGGNVSLYNESAGTDIDPTPVVAVLGVIDDLVRRPPPAALVAGTCLVLVGVTDPDLAGTRWAVDRRGHRGGVLPGLDLAAHRRLLRLVADLVADGDLVVTAHDVSDGGLGVALAECAVASGVGCVTAGVDGHRELFSESPGRVLLGTTDPHEVLARAAAAGIPARILGHPGGDRLVVDGLLDVSVSAATAAWRDALPGALGQPPAA
jgi:phosphoribosylformylglycinamidine synthase subunit PurL